MKIGIVFILTSEPYHDNSRIVGVYADEKTAVAVFKAAPNPANINDDDYVLSEWDSTVSTELRQWTATGTQIREPDGRGGTTPTRKEFVFRGPDGEVLS